ncbi:uncharacterized [Tachysurus ichikawai]
MQNFGDTVIPGNRLDFSEHGEELWECWEIFSSQEIRHQDSPIPRRRNEKRRSSRSARFIYVLIKTPSGYVPHDYN